MAHSIGKTIATLRKEKGWTQVELAEKLKVSDKAVSKWEKDDAFPSVEFFPILAELFEVNIDYLMTGKIVDIITLDDMDDGKRLMYLIKKDDVNNFEKYNYHKKNDGLPVEAVVEILNSKSIKIFNLCAEKPEYLTTRKGYSRYTPVGSIYDYIDDFVKLACLAGNVDFLDYIKFKSFAIGKANLEKNVYCNQYQPAYKADIAYCIKQETLDFIFSNENIPEKIIDYMCSYCIFDSRFLYHSQIYDYHKMNAGNCNMTLEIIKQLYTTRRYTLLENLIEQLRMEIEKLRESLGTNRIVGEHEYVHHENARIVPYGEYFIIVYTYSSQRLGKAVRFPKEFIYSIVLNNDKEWANVFIEHNKLFNTLNISPSLKAYAPSDEELEQLLKQASKERLIEKIKKDASISEHERRCKLAKENALSVDDAVLANDYEAFAIIEESKRNQINAEFLSRNGVQDVRFYIYAVNVSDDLEYLHKALKNILEKYPERYDIQDVLLSAGALIDGNIAFTSILKQNLIVLNKQTVVENDDVEVDESVTKQQLIEKIEDNKLQYVIVNVTIQLERRLKTHIIDQIDLSEKIDKALNIGIIDAFTCKLLHKLRMARNSIMHTGNKQHYTAEIVKMWVEAVYSIK